MNQSDEWGTYVKAEAHILSLSQACQTDLANLEQDMTEISPTTTKFLVATKMRELLQAQNKALSESLCERDTILNKPYHAAPDKVATLQDAIVSFYPEFAN